VTVRVITDTAAALDREVAESHGVRLVPIRVNVGDEAYLDGEIALAELIERVDEGIRTSGPSPGAFLEALEGAGDGAVIVTVASALSSTHRSARVAAGEIPGPVAVVDTGSAAGAQALVALHAAEVAAAGADLDTVAAAARAAASEVRLFGALETLDYLIRGGRVNGLVGNIVGSLGLRPVFELRDGDIRRHRPAFSRQGSIDRLFGAWERSRVDGARLHCVALHALAPDDAEVLLDRVRAAAEPATALVAEFGPGMVAHTGPGLIGLSWWWERV
jgi:DegV family protein with EDD domain